MMTIPYGTANCVNFIKINQESYYTLLRTGDRVYELEVLLSNVNSFYTICLFRVVYVQEYNYLKKPFARMATGSTDVVPVDQLESLLTCSIYLETLNDPRTLPCFHSFCKCCLERFVKKHCEKAVGKEIKQFSCPTCRSEFTLKLNEEVAEMGNSNFIRNMLDVMAIQRRAKTSKCSVCQEPRKSRSSTCEKFMCAKCSATHDIWLGNKKHIVLSISELIQPENQAKIKAKLHCKKHENKSLKFYCETCKELICRYCMDFDHVQPDHLCYPLPEVAKKQREVLRSRCEFLEQRLKEGNQMAKLISNVTQSLKENAKNAKNKIDRQKKKL